MNRRTHQHQPRTGGKAARPKGDQIRSAAKGTPVTLARAAWVNTTLAYELARLLKAPLVALEWDEGCVSRAWGYRHEERSTAPLLTALAKGTTPRLLPAQRRSAAATPTAWFASSREIRLSTRSPPVSTLTSTRRAWVPCGSAIPYPITAGKANRAQAPNP